MLIEPSINELLEKADSRYTLVIETANLVLWITVWVSRQQSYVGVKCI